MHVMEWKKLKDSEMKFKNVTEGTLILKSYKVKAVSLSSQRMKNSNLFMYYLKGKESNALLYI